jgi:hypothetical protein
VTHVTAAGKFLKIAAGSPDWRGTAAAVDAIRQSPAARRCRSSGSARDNAAFGCTAVLALVV